MILFNYGYHLNYLNSSKKNERGKELALIGIITLIATAIAPYLGSIIATNINFAILFIISSIIILLGTLPLFFSKDKYEKINFTTTTLFEKIFSKNNRGNFISFSSYAVESIIGRILWPIFIIIILGTIAKTGLIVSLSMLISLISFYFIGKLTDRINKIKLLIIGTLLYFLGWLARIFAKSSYKILLIDSYKNLSEKILYLPWSAHSYDLAKQDNYYEFIVAREIIYNLIRIIILPLLIFLFWFNYHPFIISFIIASIFSLGYVFIKK